MSIHFNLSKVGLEVYTTEKPKEEDVKDKENDKDKKKEQSNDESKKEETTDETSTDASNNYTLETGEIIKIDYIGELYSDSYEQDYTDISSNTSVSVPTDYLNYFYKGRRVGLRKGWQQSDTILQWDEMNSVFTGFITEISWNKDKIDLKFNGMDKLLEKNETFTFTKTKRSKIVEEIITASGLKAKVDVTGLKDEEIDFTNASSTSSDDSGSASSTGSATIDEAVKSAIQGKTDALSKAKAIDKAFKSHIIYSYYFDCKFSDIEKAWKHVHLNCADGANILCAMFNSAGLNATIIHVPSHYIVRVKIDGKTYYTDNAAISGNHTSRPFGEVWRGITSGSEVGKKISA